jgi:hypothetical protein
MSDAHPKPTYELADLQRLVRVRHYDVTLRAEQDAADLGLSRAEIAVVVLALTPGDFYKTMEAEKAPGRWQDVYLPLWSVGEGRPVELYVKLQIGHRGQAVVISFKER